MMPGIRPNKPAADVPSTSRLFAPDRTPENEMTIAEYLDPDGSLSLRVDCNCNAYSKETVTVPFVVIADALKGVEPGDNGRTVSARVMSDPRITAVRTGDPSPRPPSGDFNVTHVAQVAAHMRIRRLIPFSPFASNAYHLKQTRAEYEIWVARWDAQAAAPETTTAEVSAPVFTGSADLTAAAAAVHAEMPEPSEFEVPNDWTPVADEDPFAGYPTPDHATAVVEWVGDDYARALHAWNLEDARPGGVRKTVREHVDSLGVDTAEA